MIIIQYAILNAYISSIGYYYLVTDCIASIKILALTFNYLGNAEFCFCSFSRYCRRCFNFFRIFSSCSRCISGYSIHDLACVYVSLSYFVSVSELCFCIRCKVECLVAEINMIVFKYAILDRYITFVLNNYGVLDLIANCYILCRISSLGDAEFCFCSLSRYCRRCFNFFRIFSSCGSCIGRYCIHDLACVYVSLSYFVSVSEFCFCSRRKVECLAAEISVIIIQHTILDAYISGICNYHSICYCIAYSNSACGGCSLGDVQLSGCSLCSYLYGCIICYVFVLGILTCRRYGVVDLTLIHVSLCHCVGVGDSFLLGSGCQVKCFFFEFYQRIIKCDSLNGNISGVLYYYGVSDYIIYSSS